MTATFVINGKSEIYIEVCEVTEKGLEIGVDFKDGWLSKYQTEQLIDVLQKKLKDFQVKKQSNE